MEICGIEEAIEYLKLKIKNDNLTIQGMFGDIYEEIQKDNTAIETLLTAYEKEKEKNKRLEKFIENGEYTWEQKYNETFEYFKEELEKEKKKNKELEKKLDEISEIHFPIIY